MSWDLHADLAALEEQHLLRRLRVQESGALSFASNDYIGLAQSAELQQALAEGVSLYGAGSGASRLVTGTKGPHQALEERLAAFKQKPAALTFSSGFAAALGAVTSLVGPGDAVVLDKLAHASLIDAAKLSGAMLRVFPHNHLDKLERLLSTLSGKVRRVLIVTESIFSMDGDAAPLREIVEIKNRHGAWLLLDEAHAVGALGPQGRGLAAEHALADQVEVHLGTLSKAVGLSGGYVAGSRALVDVMINKARSFIYTTAPLPAVAHAAVCALDLIEGSRGDELRAKLHQNIEQLRAGIAAPAEMRSAIFPYIVGDEGKALLLAEKLRSEQGIIVPAIRYPTVPKGMARLRLSVSARHVASEIARLVEALR
jgi:8-amino-7-oxononanoate synthase